MTPLPYDHRLRVLDNGLRLATERLPDSKSVSFGIWIESGSRNETPAQEGMAHLWEHLAFKGTKSRSALDIAKALDLFGGQSNAFTSREHTCFHARVVDRHLPEALEILAELALAPTPSGDDLAKEKDVVLQEIAMVEDDPEDSLMESFWQDTWPGGSEAHSILGRPETVRGFTLEQLDAWRAEHYRPQSMLVAAAGGIDHEAFHELAARLFGTLPRGAAPEAPAAGRFVPVRSLKERDCEQSHVTLSFEAMGATDERRFALGVLNAILGGNMSSRLFQEIRERRGLAYTVYSFANTLRGQGMLQIYAGVEPERTGELLEALRGELERLAGGDVTPAELEHARDHLLSVLYLSLESSEDRMSRLARNHLLLGRFVSPEETASRFEAVTLEDVRELAAAIINPSRAGLGILAPGIDPAWAEAFNP